MDRRMKKLLSINSEIELAIIKGILEGEGIPFVVTNEHFGSLFSGPISYEYTEKTILVDEENVERARELLRILRFRPAK